MHNDPVVVVLSSFLAAGYHADEEEGLLIQNPGRALSAPSVERERLRARVSGYIDLPELVAVLTLYSRDYPGREYRLSFAFASPSGEVVGPLQTKTFTWCEHNIERLTLRLDGQIRFFEQGGIYHIRFLFDGEPLCEIPLPIDWDDALRREPAAEV